MGVENYGKYAFTYSIIIYILLIVNFGFNFSATQDVSVNRNDKIYLSKVFSEVLCIRILLAVFSISIVLLVTLTTSRFEEIGLLLLNGLGIVLGTILTPSFLFQGVEKMQFVTIGAVIPKLVMICTIFFVINGGDDLSLLMNIQSLGFIISGVVSSFIAHKTIGVRILKIELEGVIDRLKGSRSLFFSTLGMSLYRESGTIIIGVFLNYEIVGFYSAAEKIVRVIQGILNPVAQSLFPYIAHRFSEENNVKVKVAILLRIIKNYALVLFCFVLLIITVLPSIIIYFTDDKYLLSILDIKLLSPLVFFGCLSYVVGIVGLVNLGYEKYFVKGVFMAGTLAIILAVIGVNLFDDKGVAIAISVSETFLFFYLFKKLYSLK
ncbi:oligosaccharide flippase family protein [Joostella atrarenae]|uniref:Oligosaccharide flippase family protein n=2 Tax=Joostella atrarenae TaxID=679257 RepID=A0ABS9J3A1_9FLAO|nr:oligosaccharide flippase family protein [Joostella atrarenae]